MSRVVPAVLTDNAGDLESMVRQAESFTDYVQMDIMDGQFVPSRSVTWRDLAGLRPRLRWEAHLMVKAPEDYIEGFREAGARRIIFHYEATATPDAVIVRIKKLGLEAGVAINPGTPVAALRGLTGRVDSLLLLSVNPGFYGAKFVPEVLGKITELRRSHPGIEIGIDGGIKENNIAEVAGTGVDVIYVGSAIFLQPDPARSFRRLSELAGKAPPSLLPRSS
ncbi:MAG: ribulose-phosphate 3-epimerase [Chloroflexi bacterium]|nr:ribulose-phosphate 3-epimerase [Chloroflexota bacterium]